MVAPPIKTARVGLLGRPTTLQPLGAPMATLTTFASIIATVPVLTSEERSKIAAACGKHGEASGKELDTDDWYAVAVARALAARGIVTKNQSLGAVRRAAAASSTYHADSATVRQFLIKQTKAQGEMEKQRLGDLVVAMVITRIERAAIPEPIMQELIRCKVSRETIDELGGRRSSEINAGRLLNSVKWLPSIIERELPGYSGNGMLGMLLPRE